MSKRISVKDIDQQLHHMAKAVPVNVELKQKLYRSFNNGSVKTRPKRTWAYAAVAAVLCLALLLWPLMDIHYDNGVGSSLQWQDQHKGDKNIIGAKRALAAELNVIEQISFVDIASSQSMAPAVWGNLLYIPVPEKGVFRLDTASFAPADQKPAEVFECPNVTFVSVSHDGNKLAYATDKGIYIYELRTGNTAALLQNSQNVFYEEPCWSPDDKNLLVTKKTIEWKEHGFDEKAKEIYSIAIDDKSMSKIADGSHAVYAPDGSYIVLERSGKIILKDTGSGQKEYVIDEGRYPAISPDGLHIAYIKTSSDKKELKPNAYVEEAIDDVYIADVEDFAGAKKITANYLVKAVNEQDWLASLKNLDEPQTLVYNGAYSYYNPVWGNDSQTLYVLKDSAQSGEMRLMRIKLSPDVLSPEATVEAWMEAVINRDDDYAKSLMSHPPDILTLSNPRPVGYTVDKAGQENGRIYVDAHQHLAYTADAYYQILDQRFYLKDTGHGYIIDEIKEIKNTQLYAREGTVYLEAGGSKSELFSIKAGRLSSLAYHPQTGQIALAVQHKDGIDINVYDIKKKTFADIASISGGDIVATGICFSASGRYIALSYGDVNAGHILLYDMQNKQEQIIDKAVGAFWAGDKLIFSIVYDSQQIRWQYDLTTGQRTLWPGYGHGSAGV